MCTSKIFGSPSVSTPAPAKVDPAPTPVSASDVEASGTQAKKRDRRGRMATVLEDRGSILGSLTTNNDGKRNYLG